MRLLYALAIASSILIPAAGCRQRPEPADLVAAALRQMPPRDIALKRERFVVSARVAAGATLASLLHAQQVAVDDVARVIASAASVFDVRKVRANQPYRLERSTSGVVTRFDY